MDAGSLALGGTRKLQNKCSAGKKYGHDRIAGNSVMTALPANVKDKKGTKVNCKLFFILF